MTNYVYTLQSTTSIHEVPSTYGCWSDKTYAIASAYNLAPSTAKIQYSPSSGEYQELRGSYYNDDDVYTIAQVEVYNIPLCRETFYTQGDSELNDEDEEVPWPDEDEAEPDYSQWYDRNPGDQYPDDAPDNYPQAVAPEDFAPCYDDEEIIEA